MHTCTRSRLHTRSHTGLYTPVGPRPPTHPRSHTNTHIHFIYPFSPKVKRVSVTHNSRLFALPLPNSCVGESYLGLRGHLCRVRLHLIPPTRHTGLPSEAAMQTLSLRPLHLKAHKCGSSMRETSVTKSYVSGFMVRHSIVYLLTYYLLLMVSW